MLPYIQCRQVQNHKLLWSVTVSKATTIYGKVTLDSSVLHGAFSTSMIFTEQLEHTQDSTQRQVAAQQQQGEDGRGAKESHST